MSYHIINISLRFIPFQRFYKNEISRFSEATVPVVSDFSLMRIVMTARAEFQISPSIVIYD
ncbi:hypothetical protein T12_8197 [Trichinella patagoniensis]|uniref:Uncharacterized protein n=1 Tax=Trichinella patagoniensis TaxID=990121 RepID=A0A0V0ZAN2_9BILA|nr:hypothetical protein T12_8197 [Trichinella patagoniensis]